MKKIPKRASRHIAIVVASLILIPPFNFYLNNILLARGMGSMVLLLYGCMVLMEVYGLYLAFKYHRVRKSVAIIAVALFSLAILSYALYSNSIGERLIRADFNPLYSELFYLFFFGLPAFLLSSSCNNWGIVAKYLYKFSPVIVFLALFAWSCFGFATWGEDSMNYMTLSYHVLTAGCVCVAQSFNGFHPVYWLASLVFFFIMVAAGCRGALVCAVLFVLLIVYRKIALTANKKTARKYIIVGISILLAIPVFYITLTSLLDDVGISSRVVDSIADNSFFSSGSRDSIRSAIVKGLEENPLGYGLYGDRYLTTKYYQEGTEYAHNIVVELLADFGVFLGAFIILLLLLLTYNLFRRYRFFRRVRRFDESLIVILLFPEGFMKLFFSDSFLMDSMFFLYLGLLVSRASKPSFGRLKSNRV